jgi:flagellar basal-body rod protein FlgB
MIDATIAILERSLALRMRAHEVHTSNVANANVPGFKARKIDFEERMREAVDTPKGNETMIAREQTERAAVEEVAPDIYEDPMARMAGDGNSVSMEREQTEIAKNTIAYEAALQLLAKKFAFQKHVLGEGR